MLLNSKSYQGLFGVKKATVDLMLSVLETIYKKLHKPGVKVPKLKPLSLIIVLKGRLSHNILDTHKAASGEL